MLLAVDIGNTNITFGGIDGGKTQFVRRISTDRGKTDVEYAVLIRYILEMNGVTRDMVDDVILCSVVPEVAGPFTAALTELLGKRVLTVSEDLDLGFDVKLEEPGGIGADILAGVAGALTYHEPPVAVIDMGTATTFVAVDANRTYLGGLIIPGPRTALDALTARASQLPGIAFGAPKNLVSKKTADSMLNGIVYSNAAMIDGIAERIEEEIGCPLTVVATGGLARFIVPYCGRKVILDDDLLIRGLCDLYNRNKKE